MIFTIASIMKWDATQTREETTMASSEKINGDVMFRELYSRLPMWVQSAVLLAVFLVTPLLAGALFALISFYPATQLVRWWGLPIELKQAAAVCFAAGWFNIQLAMIEFAVRWFLRWKRTEKFSSSPQSAPLYSNVRKV
jgi:hypothetical protein